MGNPYEWEKGKLGVQVRFLVSGRDSHPDSLQLISDRGMRSRLERKSVTSLRRATTNSPALLLYSSLSYAWKAAIVDRWGDAPKLKREGLFAEYYERDMAAFNAYSIYRTENGEPLSDEKIDEYTTNASVLNVLLKVYGDRCRLRRDMKHGISAAWSITTNEVVKFKNHVGHTLPENEQYLRRLLNEYKREGYKRLISKNHGNINARKVDDQTEQLLNDLFSSLREKPNMTEAWSMYEGFVSGYVEIINNHTGEMYNPKEYKRLGESTVRGYLSKWENEIATHAKRSGDRQRYMQRFKPYHSLEQPKRAGSIISIDDRQPAFEYEKGKRMWFYNGIDLGSESFVCWVHGKDKEGIILDFYRQMVRNYAQWGLPMPAELEAELNLNASYKDTFLKEGNMFQYVRIEANNARGKRIEQYYRPLRYEYEKKRQGWLARPFALSEANQAGGGTKQLIPYSEIVEGCLLDIQTWNNSEHSKIKGKSRWDVFLATQNPDVRPTNYQGILPHLGYRTKSSVNAGIIRFRSGEYLLGIDGVISTGERLISQMVQVEQQDIDIYWLDDNIGNTLKAMIYRGGRYICDAVEKPAYNKARIEQRAEDLLNRELMSKYVATIEGYGRMRKASLNNLTVIDNRSRTIGTSFSIAGLSQPLISDEPAKIIETFTNENEHLNNNSTSFKRDFTKSF